MSIPPPSEHGIQFIAEHEGFRSHPYQDVAGVWTIGYGETRGIGPNTPPWTQAQAMTALHHRVDQDFFPPIRSVCEEVGLSLNQNQVDALTSCVYNLGPGILDKGRTMGDAIRSKNIHAIADAFLVYVDAGGHPVEGLKVRREQERALFLK